MFMKSRLSTSHRDGSGQHDYKVRPSQAWQIEMVLPSYRSKKSLTRWLRTQSAFTTLRSSVGTITPHLAAASWFLEGNRCYLFFVWWHIQLHQHVNVAFPSWFLDWAAHRRGTVADRRSKIWDPSSWHSCSILNGTQSWKDRCRWQYGFLTVGNNFCGLHRPFVDWSSFWLQWYRREVDFPARHRASRQPTIGYDVGLSRH